MGVDNGAQPGSDGAYRGAEARWLVAGFVALMAVFAAVEWVALRVFYG